MIPKNRIHLSRHLHAQTTPYPEVGSWLKRAVVLSIILLAFGIYWSVRPHNAPDESVSPKGEQEILGEKQAITSELSQSYKVQTGDTLFSVSQRFNISWQTLAELNALKEPYLLRIGQEIKIPRQ